MKIDGGDRIQASLGKMGRPLSSTVNLWGHYYGVVLKVNEKDPLVVDVMTPFGRLRDVLVAGSYMGSEQFSIRPLHKDDIVLVVFLGGNFRNPVIVGTLPERDRSLYEIEFKKMHSKMIVHKGNPNDSDYSESEVTADVDCQIDEEANMTLTIKGLSGNLTIITDGVTQINAPEIVLGSDGEHKIPFGDELVKWLNSHTHVNGNAGSPTGTPIKPVLDKQVNSQQNRTD